MAWYWLIKQKSRVLHLNCAIGMGSGNEDWHTLLILDSEAKYALGF